MREANEPLARELGEMQESLSESDWAEWDAQIKRDAASGKLEHLLATTKEAKDENWCALFNGLPVEVQELALRNYERFKANPYHSSVHFARVAGCWSVHAGRGYRALATEIDAEFIWSWIGSRNDYDRMINRGS
jgi:hypothetical protein